MNNLVLQAYGAGGAIEQARFCLLTFLHFALGSPARYRAVVYTDVPEHFRDLGTLVSTETVTGDRLRRWRGRIDFVHRVKLEMLADAFGKYDGAMLYVDSDTYFTADPAVVFGRIERGAAVMHQNEGRLDEERNTVARKLRRFVNAQAVTLASGEAVRIPDSTAMWNAGVIGLHESDRGELASALPLTDALYAAYAKHNMEQLAVSYTLGRRLAIRPAEDAIHHYWAVKPQIDAMLRDFFARTAGLRLEALARAAIALRPTATPLRKRHWYDRLLGTR